MKPSTLLMTSQSVGLCYIDSRSHLRYLDNNRASVSGVVYLTNSVCCKARTAVLVSSWQLTWGLILKPGSTKDLWGRGKQCAAASVPTLLGFQLLVYHSICLGERQDGVCWCETLRSPQMPLNCSALVDSSTSKRLGEEKSKKSRIFSHPLKNRF